MKRIAVDPGDVHVGIAEQNRDGGKVMAREEHADHAVESIENTLYNDVELIIEEFRLYPGQAAAQSWSPMQTAEMIGALKYVAKKKGALVIMQGAMIKKPTRAQLKARGITQVGEGGHARDAELHLWYRILRQREQGDA